MEALLVVDVQRDFCPGEALAVKDGDAVIPVLNRLMDRFPVVLASKDWHPLETSHFTKWPVHCVRGTPGAEFHPDLDASRIQKVFHKGTEPDEDGYSLFQSHETPSPAEWLRQRGVDRLYVGGLAADFCVMWSAIEAAKEGFQTFLVADATRAVESLEKALARAGEAGVKIVRAEDILSRKPSSEAPRR